MNIYGLKSKNKPLSVKLSQFFALSLTASVIAGFSSTSFSTTAARAENSAVSRAQKYRNDGNTALEAGKYAKAITAFGSALKQMDQDGQNSSPEYLSTLIGLARAHKESDQLDAASQRINEAANLARKLGNGAPELQATFDSINALCKQVDIDTLGTGTTNALKSNSSTMTVVKDSSGYKVTIRTPAKFESSTGNDKVDMLGLDPVVTFSLAQDSDGTVRVYDVKGMRMHSVEKAMWVNFFGCRFGPQNEQSYRPSTISAGKMGVVKEVSRDLPPRIFAPVAGILAAISTMGQPVDPPLPAYTAPIEAVSKTEPASQNATTTSPPTSQTEAITKSQPIGQSETRPASTPVVQSETPPVSTPVVQSETPPASTPVVQSETSPTSNSAGQTFTSEESKPTFKSETGAQDKAADRAARQEEERARREGERKRRAEEHARHDEEHRQEHLRHDKDHDDDDDDKRDMEREKEREAERERERKKEREKELLRESEKRDDDKD